MKKDEQKLDFGHWVFMFVIWMIAFGLIPVLIFFSEDIQWYKDYMFLTKALVYIAIAFFITQLIYYTYDRFKIKLKNSEEVKSISINLSTIFKTKIVQNSISAIVIVCLLSFFAIGAWGTTELDKPFNKFSYEAVYKGSLSKNSNLKNIEQIEMTVQIDRQWFSRSTIQLKYIYYNNKDIEFDNDPVYLEVGEFVPVEFYLDGNDHKWYIQMSNVKIRDNTYIPN